MYIMTYFKYTNIFEVYGCVVLDVLAYSPSSWCYYTVISYVKRLTKTYITFDTFDCLAASNWPPGHPRSDHHVSNPHRPDYY